LQEGGSDLGDGEWQYEPQTLMAMYFSFFNPPIPLHFIYVLRNIGLSSVAEV